MGSLSSFNCIRHYILHHHLMQYSELFCVSVVQGSSPREMKTYSSASLLMGKDFSRSLLLIGNASLTQGSKAWIYAGAAKTACSFPPSKKKSLSWSHPSWGLLAAACPSLGDPVGPCSFRGAGQEPPSSPAFCRWAGGEADLCSDLEQHAEISAAGMFSVKSTFWCCAVIYLFFPSSSQQNGAMPCPLLPCWFPEGQSGACVMRVVVCRVCVWCLWGVCVMWGVRGPAPGLRCPPSRPRAVRGQRLRRERLRPPGAPRCPPVPRGCARQAAEGRSRGSLGSAAGRRRVARLPTASEVCCQERFPLSAKVPGSSQRNTLLLKMSGCRKRCKREIMKFAQYLLRLITGSLHTGNDCFSLWSNRAAWWQDDCLRLM